MNAGARTTESPGLAGAISAPSTIEPGPYIVPIGMMNRWPSNLSGATHRLVVHTAFPLTSAGKLLVLVFVLFFVSGKSKSDVGIAHRVCTSTPATQAVTIRRHTSIRDISAERVHYELASVHKVGHRARRGPSGVRNFARRIETEQHLACPCVSSVEFSISLAEENHITGNEHTGFRRLRDANLPNNFTCPRVGGPVHAKGLCAWHMIEEGRAQVQVSIDRLVHKARIACVCLEDVRVMPRAVVHVFCSRAESCRRPFTSSVIPGHDQPQRFIGRSVLRR